MHLGHVDVKGTGPSVRLSAPAPVIDPRTLEFRVIVTMCPPVTRREKKKAYAAAGGTGLEIVVTGNLLVTTKCGRRYVRNRAEASGCSVHHGNPNHGA